MQHNNEVADRTPIRWPTHGMWGPTSPGNLGSSCPMSVASARTKKCDEVVANGYEGFRLSPSGQEQRFAAN